MNINNNKQRKMINRSSPFGQYFNYMEEIDTEWKNSNEYGSILLLSLVEEVGEMARAYLAEHGRKRTNLAAINDEAQEAELGDILISILRLARIKNIDLHERIMYSLNKIKKRKLQPKV